MVIKRYIRIASFFALVSSITVFAQTAVQPVTTLEATGWYSIQNRAISDDGRWVFFTKLYDSGTSEGMLKDLTTGKSVTISEPGKFYLDNHLFAVMNTGRELFVSRLGTSGDKVYSEVADFDYDEVHQTLLIHRKDEVLLLNPAAKNEQKFSGITKADHVPGTPCTWLTSSAGVQLLNRLTGKTVSVLKDPAKLLTSVGEQENRRIKFVWQDATGPWVQNIGYSGEKLSAPVKIAPDETPTDFSFLSPHVLMEKKRIVPTGSKPADTVEIWSSADKALKPKLMRMLSSAETITLHDLSHAGRAAEVYRNFTTDYYLVFDGGYILEVLPLENYDFNIQDLTPRPRIRLRNRTTQEVEMEVPEVKLFYPSANRRYLLYFKEKDWYFYDVITRRTINITGHAGVDFHSYDRLNTIAAYPFETPWFSRDYRFIYLTSKKDIWQYDTEKRKLKKITADADPDMAFRIKEQFLGGGVSRMTWTSNPVLQHNSVLLSMLNTKSEVHQGLAVWKDNRLHVIVPPDKQLIDQIKKSEGAVSWQVQNANTPPKLMRYVLVGSSPKMVLDSGEGLYGSSFPRTVFHEWTNAKGEYTNTTVVLPPGYSPGKKYPAIVHIYENEAKRFREFEFPTVHNSTGFNRTLMAMNGYIVILPHIIYSRNRVGQSALQSVEETVRKVQQWYSVDLENIGIIGHSFGGYETSYILTMTSMFKAAVSSSGLHDIISDYFTVHKDFRFSNMSHYTNQQFGFSDGFFKIKQAYLDNSPILHADRITTPLMLWSGSRDNHVEWRQSVAMFMALASLKKEVRLLLYPDDIHVLVRRKNQAEATRKTLEWFDYYLKGGKKPAWF